MAVVSTGFFDGVHLGHRHVIDRLLSEAKAAGEESVVVTFWPHPRNVLQDDARNLRLLTSLQEKQLLLNGLGVDRIEVIPFTREFSRMTTETYLREVLIGRFGAGTVILGYDNRIGSDLLSSEDIVPIAERLGLRAIVESPVTVTPEGVTVSSTKIREALAEGRVGDAGAMLGYRYCLHGVVVAGNKLGRTIGFPTANMQLYDPLKMIPSNGVYAVVVEGNRLGRTIGFPTANMQLFEPRKMVPADGVYYVAVETLGRRLDGMCNIGVRPTVGQGNARTIETNIFDFDEDIYGLDIRVRFIDKIRDEHQFDSLQSLASQLFLDREACLGKIPAPSL